jgi:hypothetical protein
MIKILTTDLQTTITITNNNSRKHSITGDYTSYYYINYSYSLFWDGGVKGVAAGGVAVLLQSN